MDKLDMGELYNYKIKKFKYMPLDLITCALGFSIFSEGVAKEYMQYKWEEDEKSDKSSYKPYDHRNESLRYYFWSETQKKEKRKNMNYMWIVKFEYSEESDYGNEIFDREEVKYITTKLEKAKQFIIDYDKEELNRTKNIFIEKWIEDEVGPSDVIVAEARTVVVFGKECEDIDEE